MEKVCIVFTGSEDEIFVRNGDRLWIFNIIKTRTKPVGMRAQPLMRHQPSERDLQYVGRMTDGNRVALMSSCNSGTWIYNIRFDEEILEGVIRTLKEQGFLERGSTPDGSGTTYTLTEQRY